VTRNSIIISVGSALGTATVQFAFPLPMDKTLLVLVLAFQMTPSEGQNENNMKSTISHGRNKRNKASNGVCFHSETRLQPIIAVCGHLLPHFSARKPAAPKTSEIDTFSIEFRGSIRS
jgi:hypothetical protein